ncbi:MAG: NAD-dependent epimerase/dehydratase family protein [Candidatus Rokuibacteriota bacterium]
MRVLVTGGAGFIGSFVVERLLRGGDAVRVLDNLDPQVHPDGRPPALAAGAELIVGDVRDRASCARALEDVDAVVHAAAAVGVAQALYRVEHFVDVNVRGTATLLESLIARRDRLAKLVVLTSMTAYGEGVYRRPSDGRLVRARARDEAEIQRSGWEPSCPETGESLLPAPTPEDADLLARNVYAVTKRYAEELALSLGAVYGFPVVCLRLFNVYGPRQSLSNPYTGVLAIFLSRLLGGERPVVYEDGRQSRDFVAVHDVTEAVVAALRSPAADGQAINVGSGVAHPIADVARLLARAVGAPHLEPEITHRFRRGDVRHCTADIARARRLLGFAPRVAFEAGVAALVAWARSAARTDHFDQAQRELREHGLLTSAIRPPSPDGRPE